MQQTRPIFNIFPGVKRVYAAEQEKKQQAQQQVASAAEATVPVASGTSTPPQQQQQPQTEEWRQTAFARYLAMALRPANKKALYGIMRSIADQRMLLAYQSELGEAFRPVSHVYFVRALYALSIGYVLADIGVNAMQDHDAGMDSARVAYRAIDLTVWHTFASMVLPTYSVHEIVKYSGMFMNKLPQLENLPQVRKWVPVFLGLFSIFGTPLAHWLDHGVTWVMDNTSRKYFAQQLYGTDTVPQHKE